MSAPGDGQRTVEIRLNGETRAVTDGQPLTELLDGLGFPPETLLVEHNGRALLRGEWADVRLAAGDRVEILRVVAGG